MANFNTHLITASTISGIAATALFGVGVLSGEEALLNFALGSVGGLLPDLDSDNSIIVKAMFSVIAVIIAFMTVFRLSTILFIAEMMLAWLAAFIVVYFIGFGIFKRFTVHRGIFHSIPAGVLFGFIIIFVFSEVLYFPSLSAWMTGFFVMIGYLVHLILDEIYSVDLANQKIKRSFGSAVKLWQSDNIPGTVIVYSIILVGFFLLPPAQPFVDTIFNPALIATFKERLLPANSWFMQLR